MGRKLPGERPGPDVDWAELPEPEAAGLGPGSGGKIKETRSLTRPFCKLLGLTFCHVGNPRLSSIDRYSNHMRYHSLLKILDSKCYKVV